MGDRSEIRVRILKSASIRVGEGDGPCETLVSAMALYAYKGAVVISDDEKVPN